MESGAFRRERGAEFLRSLQLRLSGLKRSICKIALWTCPQVLSLRTRATFRTAHLSVLREATLPQVIAVNAIAIDGPAASGKSTVGFQVGQRLGFLFFDTGVMYRAVAWAILDKGLSSSDSEAVGRIAEALPIGVSAPRGEESDGRRATIQIGEVDVTWSIRNPEVDSIVSAVAANQQVRQALTRKQRLIGLEHGSGAGEEAGVVMVGRDIGTVVLPEAPLKIYLGARLGERARRRFRELSQRGKATDLTTVTEDMRLRDQIDSERAVAPLRPARDAHRIQTDGATVEEVVEQILSLAAKFLRVGPAATGDQDFPFEGCTGFS